MQDISRKFGLRPPTTGIVLGFDYGQLLGLWLLQGRKGFLGIRDE